MEENVNSNSRQGLRRRIIGAVVLFLITALMMMVLSSQKQAHLPVAAGASPKPHIPQAPPKVVVMPITPDPSWITPVPQLIIKAAPAVSKAVAETVKIVKASVITHQQRHQAYAKKPLQLPQQLKGTNRVKMAITSRYLIQVGTFKHIMQAKAVVTSLSKQGLSVHLVPFNSVKGQAFHKVIVGSYQDLEKVKRLKQTIDRTLHVRSAIMKASSGEK